MDEQTSAADPHSGDSSPCLRCGYNLRSLSPTTLCPECALPVIASTGGGYLAHSDPLWVARLQLAAALGVATAIVTLVSWLPHLLPTLNKLPRAVSLTTWCFSVGTLLATLSAWLLASPEPDERPNTLALIRRALRAVAAAILILHIFGLDHWRYAWENFDIVTAPLNRVTVPLSMALDIALNVLFYLYLWRLGKLLADPFLIRHSLLVMAGMIALVILNRVVPALIEWFGSTAGGYRPPAVPPLAQGLVACSMLVYTLLLERQAYLAFTTAATAARENWTRRGAPTLSSETA